jgi:hypothetical protein
MSRIRALSVLRITTPSFGDFELTGQEAYQEVQH